MKAGRSIAVKLLMVLALVACTGLWYAWPAKDIDDTISTGPRTKTMRPFHSEQELVSYLRKLQKQQMRRQKMEAMLSTDLSLSSNMAAPAPPASKTDSAGQPSITNVQHAGVDEGDIVKLHGKYLVVLRRGRLFTISMQDEGLIPVSSINAYGPDIDPSGSWYDEMMIYDDTIAVVGYSYERGGTEVGLFTITPEGKLSYRSTYHLRSNDYYSSRNYASRLIGSKLIFYSPLYLYTGSDPLYGMPAIRKWHKGANDGEFRRINTASDVYRPNYAFDSMTDTALHTVTICDLASHEFNCKATSVVGPMGRVFYVSPTAVYVWCTDWQRHGTGRSLLYRMPLDGGGPTALEVQGSPVDQFSFLESQDGYLNILVQYDGGGDGMWNAEVHAGGLSLLRVAVTSFMDGSSAAPASAYRRLAKPEGPTYTMQNRFVGDYLLYGTGSGWADPQKNEGSVLYAVRWAEGKSYLVPLDQGTDRIEQMGSNAVVIGSEGEDLHFTAIQLGDSPEVADEFVRGGVSQGELRSHGFFYRSDTEDSGLIGLPISEPARPGYRHLIDTSSAVLFVKNDSLHFADAGELGAEPSGTMEDGCRASCVDWYGNSRPIFVHGKIYALLGYELVEGALEGGRIRETQRVSYAPRG
jgi:Beta propeller domain